MPRRYYFHDYLSVCPNDCYQDYTNTTGWKFNPNNQKTGLSPTIRLNKNFKVTWITIRMQKKKKKNPDFSIYLLLRPLAEVCALRMLSFYVQHTCPKSVSEIH